MNDPERPIGGEGSGAPEFSVKSSLATTTGWGPRVIVCILFDQPSGWRALDWAVGATRAAGSVLIVVHVPRAGYEWLIDSSLCCYASAAVRDAADGYGHQVIGEVASLCRGIPHRIHVFGDGTAGSPRMLRLADDNQADLLVVGASARWRSPSTRSVSRSLGCLGRVPTLVIP